jgi:ankyrin repeat protein
MYDFLENRKHSRIDTDNSNIQSIYDIYSDSGSTLENTSNSYKNQLNADSEKNIDNDISYYDYLTKNEIIEKNPTQIIECENKKALMSTIMQTKIDHILFSAICNPDHGMQAAINFVISGENINDQDNATKTSPLHFAAQWNAYKLGTILIAKQADVNSQDIHGNTPLHILALYSDVDTDNKFAEILLNAGANLFIKNNDGKTAAKIALELQNINLYNSIKDANQSRLLN